MDEEHVHLSVGLKSKNRACYAGSWDFSALQPCFVQMQLEWRVTSNLQCQNISKLRVRRRAFLTCHSVVVCLLVDIR